MIYHVIGTMSGSSLDGLDIVHVELSDVAGQWEYIIHQADTVAYTTDWVERIRRFDQYSAQDYVQLDSDLGYYMGEIIRDFIQKYDLTHKIHFISSHGHTSFHEPQLGYTAQIGAGANIAKVTGKPTITDLRQMDVAHGGQGAPIVPLAEKLLFGEHSIFLNLGGIANISVHSDEGISAYDVTAANRVLNLLAGKEGLDYDAEGNLARTGQIDPEVLNTLNAQVYFDTLPPKSLANHFGTDTLYPILDAAESVADALSTYTEHIAMQVAKSIKNHTLPQNPQMLITGGGAYNSYLMERISTMLAPQGITTVKPDNKTVEYKEALAMALLGVLRWREEPTVLSDYSGARDSSIGGALWMV